jgi:hypothetical protein
LNNPADKSQYHDLAEFAGAVLLRFSCLHEPISGPVPTLQVKMQPSVLQLFATSRDRAVIIAAIMREQDAVCLKTRLYAGPSLPGTSPQIRVSNRYFIYFICSGLDKSNCIMKRDVQENPASSRYEYLYDFPCL